ncbi:rabenosyn-5 [Topomyia yanbarensis]|uniref:rabenosyn-5 n=1 Tax=Topomyia yanbarensis TaxID=2498891 RepID=UPI00273ADB9E|nr:rabenosyn-5 [Topomyia yanbarensis]XP_058835729.1 rabenosyn-5 [Topomyia yanbarensis]XP_058835737.1 rabenosyn-5 [Topomyia yanbarensis]
MSNPFDDPADHQPQHSTLPAMTTTTTGSSGSSSLLLLGSPDDSEILEGFLCPICKADLKTPERLTAHVEQEHSEEQDLLKSLKEMFSFAKKKILNLDETANDLARSFDSSLQVGGKQERAVAVANPILLPGQLVGTDCDHMSYFRAVRNPRLERYASETNKLIIRLDKLLDGLPSEMDARKRHEQSKVPWIDGKLVKLCPSCAKSFGLTRRQHHCRVCGSVMCDGCSFHLSFEEARSIVQPVSPGIEPPKTTLPLDETGKDRESSGFRVCEHCLHLLMNRKEMQDSRSDRPLITKLYDRLLQEKKDIAPDIPMYSRIIHSLYEGDAIYRLSDASALREKMARAAERIDNISKTILAIPLAPGSREEALKKAIRLSSISYIKEQMLSIPPLPAEEEIKKIQLRKKQETARRIERERRLALEAYEKYELQSEPYNGSSSSSTASTAEMTNGRYYGAAAVASTTATISSSDNWSGYQAANVTVSSSADPLIDQINIVKGYIRQAREALRFEEVETLERNLSELTQEFYERQRRVSAGSSQGAGGGGAMSG